jgi:hypothetical protein
VLVRKSRTSKKGEITTMLLAPLGIFLGGFFLTLAQAVQGMPDIGQTLATLFEVLAVAHVLYFLVL